MDSIQFKPNEKKTKTTKCTECKTQISMWLSDILTDTAKYLTVQFV